MAKGNGRAAGASWNDQVAELMKREGVPREKARDQVIMQHLRRGDTQALAAMLLEGHVPAPNVRFAIALMLLENEDAEAALTKHHMDGNLWVPHRFALKGRPDRPRRSQSAKDGAKTSPENRHGAALMPEIGYQVAIARLDEAVRATDGGGGKAAAADKRSPQRGPKSKRKR
jgi:hypothetical protein